MFFTIAEMVEFSDSMCDNASMSDIKELRSQIDRIDAEIQRLFEKRMEISGEIGAWKASSGMPVFDAAREEELIAELKGRASSPENAEAIETLYRTVFEVSRERQHRLAGRQQ
ncbi:MAG: chorismate mutase [Clostridiales bacterium]|nr:chorismate mutase [Clostridiales bacterium]